MYCRLALFVCLFIFMQEIVVGSNMDKIYIVMDYVEHDLKTLMEHMTNQFRIGEILFICFWGWIVNSAFPSYLLLFPICTVSCLPKNWNPIFLVFM